MKSKTVLLAAGFVIAVLAPVRGQTVTKAPAEPVTTPPYVAQVFDLTKLHRIVVTIPEANQGAFRMRGADRGSGTVSFDGTVLTNVGIRQQGGSYLPYVGFDQKPSLSIKFNEFVKGQDLFGLKKIVLKNQIQDESLVNEHMTYEIFRRAGQAAPLTAYAQVSINGRDQGIYLIREPINQQFLERNFGKGMEKGNLYEITLGSDPIRSPGSLDLKDEVEEKRTRDDIRAMASAFASVRPGTFVQRMSPHLNVDRFITFYALETAVSQGDGYTFYNNNTYLYSHPRDGFIFIPHGADLSFWAFIPSRRIRLPSQQTRGGLALGILADPALKKKYDEELLRVGSDPIWNKAALLARVEQVGKVLATAEPSSRTRSDISRFTAYRAMIETFIKGGGTTRGVDYMSSVRP